MVRLEAGYPSGFDYPMLRSGKKFNKYIVTYFGKTERQNGGTHTTTNTGTDGLPDSEIGSGLVSETAMHITYAQRREVQHTL